MDLYTLDLKVLSIEQAFGDFIFSVHCPPWHRHTMQYQVETSANIMQNISVLNNFMYDCRECPEGFYVVSSYNQVIKSSGNILSKEMADCLECPYGAICSGNNIIPRPNYWGYWKEGNLMFLQCPSEYCCSGSESAPCVKYNSCAGNRTGILCGACKRGFSVSILTGECMPDSECGKDQWFWLLALLATAAYALWYAFKDDVIFLFFSLCSGLKYLFCTFQKCRQNDNQAEIAK